MTTEEVWYSMYTPGGQPPHCTRLSRLPMDRQWNAPLDFAIGFALGTAGYRQTWITRTREKYWYLDGAWWLIPDRIEKRIMALYSDAVTQACMRNRGHADSEEVVAVLRSWRRTGVWRRHVAHIIPRRELITSVIPRGKGKRGKRSVDIAAVQDRAAQLRTGIGLFSPASESTARVGAVYRRSDIRNLQAPAGHEWVQCDEGHMWVIPMGKHAESCDRCPKCGGYWC